MLSRGCSLEPHRGPDLDNSRSMLINSQHSQPSHLQCSGISLTPSSTPNKNNPIPIKNPARWAESLKHTDPTTRGKSTHSETTCIRYEISPFILQVDSYLGFRQKQSRGFVPIAPAIFFCDGGSNRGTIFLRHCSFTSTMTTRANILTR